jgi:hypothetical protein
MLENCNAISFLYLRIQKSQAFSLRESSPRVYNNTNVHRRISTLHITSHLLITCHVSHTPIEMCPYRKNRFRYIRASIGDRRSFCVSYLRSHIIQMLHRQEIHIQEPINAIRKTSLLALIQLGVLNVTRDAFLPANASEVVSFCFSLYISRLKSFPDERTGKQKKKTTHAIESASAAARSLGIGAVPPCRCR